MKLDRDKIKKGFDSFLETKVSRLGRKQKILICLVAGVIPVAAFFFLLFSPKNEEINKLRARKEVLELEIKKVEATVRQLDRHKAEMRKVEVQFQAASLLLPEQKEIPSLLTNISSQGANSGLEFLSFKPRGEVAREFYAEIPVDITVRGPYHNVGVFLDKISKLPRIVTVSNLSMGSPFQSDNEIFLNTTFNLVTYRFIEPVNGNGQQNSKQKR